MAEEHDFQHHALIAIIALLGLILIVAVWFVFTARSQPVEISDAEQVVPALTQEQQGVVEMSETSPEVEETIRAISRLTLVPAGEVAVVTVSNAELLKERHPVAFQLVQNGDKLLVYEGGVITYDPTQDKIVDIFRLPHGESSEESDIR